MHQQTNLSFEIYSTLEKDVWYTTGKRGKGSQDTAPVELRKIGAFVVQMPDFLHGLRTSSQSANIGWDNPCLGTLEL